MAGLIRFAGLQVCRLVCWFVEVCKLRTNLSTEVCVVWLDL